MDSQSKKTVLIIGVTLILVVSFLSIIAFLVSHNKSKNNAIDLAEQELLESTNSPYAKTEKTADGEAKTTFYSNPVFYKDERGEWQTVDTTITKSNDPTYAYENVTHNVKSFYKTTPQPDMVTLKWENSTVGFEPLTLGGISAETKPTIEVDSNKLTYKNLYPNIDLEYRIQEGKILSNYVLRDNKSANFDSVSFRVKATNAKFAEQDGGLILTTTDGKTFMKIEKPSIIDSNDNSTSFEKNPDELISYEFKKEADDSYLVTKNIKPRGKTWINAKERLFPLYLDPTSTFYPNADLDGSPTSADAYTQRSNAGCESLSSLHTGAGTAVVDDGTTINPASLTGNGCSDPNFSTMRRGQFFFDTSSIPEDAQVTGATFGLYASSARGNTLGDTDMIVVTNSTSSTTTILSTDYNIGNLSTAEHGRFPYGTWGTTAYNKTPITTSVISKSGLTRLTTMLGWDFYNSFTGTWGTSSTTYSVYTADQAGTDTDPRLEVTWRYVPGGYWKFDEGYGSTAYDTSINAGNGTITEATYQTADLCKSGTCLKFDGSNDVVTVTAASPIHITGHTGYTMCSWIKPLSDGESDTGQIFNKGTSNYLRVDTESSGTVKVSASIDLASSDATYTSTRTISTSDWSHVCAVYDGSTGVSVYINGMLAGSGTGSGALQSDSGNNLLIGGGTSNNFDGYIDEARVYPVAKTAAEIKTEYVGGTQTRGSSAVLGANQDSGEFLSQGLAGYWKMDEESGNSCVGAVNDSCDSSGKVNDGEWNGSTTSTLGKFGKSTIFDGSGDYIDVTDNTSINFGQDVDFTIGAWVKTTQAAAAGSWPMIVNKEYDSAGGTRQGYALVLHNSDISSIWYFNVVVNGSFYVASGSSDIADGQWHHIMGVRRGSTIYAYQDGVLANTAVASSGDTSRAVDLRIGAISGTGVWDYYQGNIDELRIYRRALDTNEILHLSEWGPGSIVQYKFDEGSGSSAYDSSGNAATGSITEAIYSPGKFGTALDFDGSNDMVDANDVAVTDFTDSTNFTVEFWMNRRTYTTDDTVVAKKNDQLNSTAGWTIWVDDTTDDVRLVVSDGDSANLHTVDSTTSFTSAGWYHVAVVYDDSASTASKIYINGVDDSATNTTTGTFGSIASLANAVDLRVASESDSGVPFGGQIDDVRVYNYIRTGKQIVQDMNAGHPSVGTPVGSAVGYWRFDHALGTNADDATDNNNDLTLSAASWISTGKFGSAFNGTNATWASKTDDPDFDFVAADSMTVSAWVKSDAAGNPGTREYVVSKGAPGAAGYALYFEATNGYPVYAIDDDTSWTTPDFTATHSTDMYDATWHHVVGVKDGTNTIKIYVDGIFRNTSASIAAEGTLANASSLVVGDSDAIDNGSEFTGDIDEVKIYRFALTSEEIKLEYNKGKAIVLGAQSTTSGSSTPDNSYDREYCVPGDSSTCRSPKIHFRMDENTGSTTIYDSSGNGFTGTMNNFSVEDWVPGKRGPALEFDSTAGAGGEYINSVISTSNFNFSNSYSISFWTNLVELGDVTGNCANADAIFIAKETSAAKSMTIRMRNTGGLSYSHHANDGTSLTVMLQTVGVTNEWMHIEIVNDSSSSLKRMYVDGVLVQATSYAGFTLENPTGDLTIGGITANCGDDFTKGVIDDVRIYDYARTAAQVAVDKDTGNPVAHYKLDECVGTTANDSSGNSLTGTVTIGASGTNTSAGSCSGAAAQAWFDGATGKYNGSLEFDDTDDYITVSDNRDLDLEFNMSLSAWVKTSANEASNVVVSKGTSYEMGVNADGDVYWDGVGAEADDGSAKVLSGTWHHIVVTNDDTTATYYVDGILTGTDAAGIDTNNATALYIGYDGTNYFDGQIDDVRVYAYPLNANQVKTLYNENSAVRFAPSSGSP